MGRYENEMAVREYFFEQMSERIKGLRHCALFDLHFGPYDAEYYAQSASFEDWPGYTKAVHELEDWADLNLTAVWAQDGHVQPGEPEGTMEDGEWVEPDLYDALILTKKEAYSIVFKELVSEGGMDT